MVTFLRGNEIPPLLIGIYEHENVDLSYHIYRVFLMTVKLYRKDIKPESIGIITPFIKQVEHLRDLFLDAGEAKIGTVEEFQGQI
ncbi:putative RNA helicase armi [Glossina fuscipes fuscipes]